MDNSQQNNQGFMQHFQSILNGLRFPHNHNRSNTATAGSSLSSQPQHTSLVGGQTPVSAGASEMAGFAHASLTPSVLEHSEPELYEPDAPISPQTIPSYLHNRESWDMQMGLSSPPQSESSRGPTPAPSSDPIARPPSAGRNTRRTRVEDELDEDNMRETNRQRMSSPLPSSGGDDHYYHPDMDAHRAASAATAAAGDTQPPQLQPQRPRPSPLISHITYVVDVLPPGVVPPPAAGADGPRVATTPFFFPFGPTQTTNNTNNGNPAVPPMDNVPLPPLPPPAGGETGNRPTDRDDFQGFLNFLRDRMAPFMMPFGIPEEEQDDPIRAKKLLGGLEEVPEGLVKRMERVGGEENEQVVCAICYENLLDAEAGESEKDEPVPMEVETESAPSPSATAITLLSPSDDDEQRLAEQSKHKVVVLPCSHVFHASCLLPWFTRPHRTTCPTCRFDIDPESLTLTPPSQRPRPRRQQPVPQPAPQSATENPHTPALEATRQAVPPPSAGAHAPQPSPAPDAQPQVRPGPVPRLHTRRTIRTPDLPFGLVVDVSVFPGPVPPSPPQPGQGPAIHIPLFGPPAMPTGQQQAQQQPQGAQGIPFFGLAPQPQPPLQTHPQPAATPAGHTNAPEGNNNNPNPRARPFNPGMAGLGGFIPTEMSFLFGMPVRPQGPANQANNANAPPQSTNQAPDEAAYHRPQPQPQPQPQFQPQFQPQPHSHPYSQPQPAPMHGHSLPPHIHIGNDIIFTDWIDFGRPRHANGTAGPRPQDAHPQTQALPSFQEVMNMIGIPPGPLPARQEPGQQYNQNQPAPPPADGGASQPQDTDQRATQAQINAVADTFARTFFQQLLGRPFPGQGLGAGAPRPPAGGAPNANAGAAPVPPGPIPFAMPTQPPPPPRPQPKRTWVLPPPPGATLRERIERKEREMGLRCSDISCGLGPTDEDPIPVADPRAVRQIHIHPLPGRQEDAGKTTVCEHAFHPACLVSAERVAGWSGADQKREVEEGEEDVEASCPACRAVGCISRADWDDGACALA